MTEELRIAGWRDRTMFMFGLRSAYTIDGHSMAPTLRDGDIVLITGRRSVKVGDIVLAAHPFKNSVRMIKRVSAICETGEIEVAGDNPAESTDSRTLGTLSANNILGRVVCRLK